MDAKDQRRDCTAMLLLPPAACESVLDLQSTCWRVPGYAVRWLQLQVYLVYIHSVLYVQSNGIEAAVEYEDITFIKAVVELVTNGGTPGVRNVQHHRNAIETNSE